jgi:ATP-dependent DNA ligase
VLPARSFLIDGEAIVTNDNGLAVFDLIRHKRHGDSAVLVAFDLIELDGEDLRRSSKGDGEIVFKNACKLGCEGIVSKRLGSHVFRQQGVPRCCA